MNPTQAEQLERIKSKVSTLGRILDEANERCKMRAHQPHESKFFSLLNEQDIVRLRKSLDLAITELELELWDLWSQINNLNIIKIRRYE